MKKILLIAISCLGACSQINESDLSTLRSGESGIRVVADRLQQHIGNPPQPAAIAGIITAAMFGKPLSEAPNEPGSMLPDGTAAEDAELIKTLVKLLEKDIQDVLNTAQDRGDGLDIYSKALESYAQKAEIRLRSLQDSSDQNDDNSSRYERRTKEIQNEIEDAIATGDTSRVTLLTDELIQKQQLLAKANVDLIVETHLIQAYEDVLEPVKNRLKAIQANRDALIKGVKVTDMPGVEDLRIIEYEDGAIRVRAGGRSFF